MSERLSELSASVALELRTRVQESRDKLRSSIKIIEGIRKEPVIINGTRSILNTIVAELEKADEQLVGLLKQINETYGTPSEGSLDSQAQSS